MIVVAIPARSGSKGVRDKNIADLGGKPLLAWSIETARQIPSIARIVVSTDSVDYAEIAREWGADEIVLRPAEISQDDSTDYEWVEHLLSLYKPEYWRLLVHLRPTTPLRDPIVILQATAKLLATPEATSLRSVHEMGETAWKCYEIGCPDYEGRGPDYLYPLSDHDSTLPRQHYPKTYHPNGYVDIYRVKHILEHGELFGDKILAFETPRVTEVDTPEDLEYLRWKIKNS